jgi:hypothetical protein
MRLLQEERNFNTRNSNVSIDMSNVNHGLESDQAKNRFGSWTQIPSNRSKLSSKSHTQYHQPIPAVVNRYALLRNLNDETEVTQPQDLIDKIKLVRSKNNNVPNKKEELSL